MEKTTSIEKSLNSVGVSLRENYPVINYLVSRGAEVSTFLKRKLDIFSSNLYFRRKYFGSLSTTKHFFSVVLANYENSEEHFPEGTEILYVHGTYKDHLIPRMQEVFPDYQIRASNQDIIEGGFIFSADLEDLLSVARMKLSTKRKE